MIYYVDAKAFRDGDGSKERPFKNIGDAANIAVAGDEILVASGVYREKVTPRNAGTEDAPIVYRSVEKLGAVITGAEEISGWENLEGNLWTVRVNNGVFADYNPYTTRVYGDWYFSPAIRHTGAVFLNDIITTESLGLAFEPEQAFERPDGTPITFGRDYFGDHRIIPPVPGPFADYSNKEILVWA